MITTEKIKLVRSLREKKFRDSLGLFVVEGEKMVQEALDSDFEVVEVFRIGEEGEQKMARISLQSSPSPALAIVRQKKAPALSQGLCLALDSVRDPGNMGTIIRLADWFGIKTVFASPDSVEVYNPKVVQSTMGAIFRVGVVYCDIPELCRRFSSQGREVYGTFLGGENIYAAPLQMDGLVVMGNESRGISPEVAAQVSRRITIPSFGGSAMESLNVAIATAITISEFKRR